MPTQLEHANVTVSDGDRTAAWMQDVFDWHIRWQGDVLNGAGRSIHIGSDDSYIALYTPATSQPAQENSYTTVAGLNHLAVTVDDITATERAVKAQGFTPVNHADYAPGRRFYFHDHDGIEYEVVSYA